jgi:hypothetical protein
MSYVASTQVESESQLRELLEKHTRGSSYYFLRWTHAVSGILTELPSELSPEGQLFNADLELRWQQTLQGYQVLLLSQSEQPGFEPLLGEWEHEDHPILLHDSKKFQDLNGFTCFKNPQYPNGFTYSSAIDRDRIQQRYFRNTKTLAVQFIALTVKP